MDPDIALAIQHHQEINSTPHFWARLEMEQFESERIIRLRIGRKNECGLITRRYFMGHNGPDFIELSHG